MGNKKIIADAIAWVHGLWVVLMLLSLPVVLLMPGLSVPVFIFSVVTVLSWIVVGACPLRLWELSMRKKHDTAGVYKGTFIRQYVNKYLGISFSEVTLRLIIYPYMALLIIVAFIEL